METNSTEGQSYASTSRVILDSFEGSSDTMRQQKLVFKYIQKKEANSLQEHLQETRDQFDIMKLFDNQGYSPLHFAAWKDSLELAEVIINFVSLLRILPTRF